MDLTNFNFRHHGLELSVNQGDLVETADGIFPEVHIMLANDDYQYVLNHTFVGFKMYDEDGCETIVKGERMAEEAILRIKAKGRVNLQNWSAASNEMLQRMGYGS